MQGWFWFCLPPAWLAMSANAGFSEFSVWGFGAFLKDPGTKKVDHMLVGFRTMGPSKLWAL